MDDNMKEVYFDQYCKTCLYKEDAETDHPCYECLNEPARHESHKPARWKKNDLYGRKNSD